MGKISHIKPTNTKQQFKHKTHERKRYEQFSLTPHEKIKTQRVSQNHILNRVSSANPSNQAISTLWSLPRLAMSHACSSYEQQDYHTSYSPSRQHSRIREIDSQPAQPGVSPHGVG